MRLGLLAIFCCVAVAGFAEEPKPVSIRGTLVQHAGKPALETADHHIISLDGDDATKGVLNDKRMAGFDLEAKGHFTAPDQFLVGPSTRARRRWTETTFDLIDPDKMD